MNLNNTHNKGNTYSATFSPRYSLPVRIIIAIVVFQICAMGIMPIVVFTPLSKAFASQDVLTHIHAALIVWPIALVLYTVAAIFLARWLDRASIRALGLVPISRGACALLVGVIISVAIALATAVVVTLVSAPTSHSDAAEQVSEFSAVPLWLALIYLVFRSFILQGIGEELLMRGYLLQSLRKHPKSSVWIAAAAFTLPHLASSSGQQGILEHLLYLVTPFGFAISAGYLAIALRSIWAAIGIHGGFHLGTVVAIDAGLTNLGPLSWIAFGLLHLIAGLITSRFITDERWQEVSQLGPYGKREAAQKHSTLI